MRREPHHARRWARHSEQPIIYRDPAIGSLDQSRTATGASDAVLAHQQAAQLYTAGITGLQTQVDFAASAVEANGALGDLTVEIRDVENGAPGPVVLGSTTLSHSSFGELEDWYSAVFAPAIPVTAGTKYAIVFRTATGAGCVETGCTLYSIGAHDDNYPDPSCTTYSDRPWQCVPWTALAFKTYVSTDNTPPIVSPVVTGTPGANGWYTGNVTVAWNVSDPDSPYTTTGCAGGSVTQDTQGQSFACAATSLGGTTTRSITIMRDASPPEIHFTGAASYNVDQTIAISCAASDPTSGVQTQSCPSVSEPAYAAGAGAHTLDASATNGAGLQATASFTYTVHATPASMSTLVNLWCTNAGVANSLTTKLAHGDVRAFVNEVNAQSGKKIAADKAAILIQLAAAL